MTTLGNHCVIADGATSEGSELNAQMLSRRNLDNNKLEAMLLDLRHSMDKTAQTEVLMFNDALKDIAALCKKVHILSSYLSSCFYIHLLILTLHSAPNPSLAMSPSCES